MFHPERDPSEPPYIRQEDDTPDGHVAWKVVGPSGKWAMRIECPESVWRESDLLYLWEVLERVVAMQEAERETPNLSRVSASTHLTHAFSAARAEASEPYRSVTVPLRLAR